MADNKCDNTSCGGNCDACDGARSCGLHPCHDQALCMHELSAEDAARELDRMTDDGGAARAV